jgi:hypothetical protein
MKLAKLGIKRQPNRLYYVSTSRSRFHPEVRSCAARTTSICVKGGDDKHEATFDAEIPNRQLAYLDKDGDVSASPMKRRTR